mgnify:CR=1 FL=1
MLGTLECLDPISDLTTAAPFQAKGKKTEAFVRFSTVAGNLGSADLARRELQRARELHEQNFVSQTYLDKQRAEAAVAGGRTDQASERRKLAQREVDLAAAGIRQLNEVQRTSLRQLGIER